MLSFLGQSLLNAIVPKGMQSILCTNINIKLCSTGHVFADERETCNDFVLQGKFHGNVWLQVFPFVFDIIFFLSLCLMEYFRVGLQVFLCAVLNILIFSFF